MTNSTNPRGAAQSVVRITMNGKMDAFPKGITVKEVVFRLLPEQAEHILCALDGGVCMELNRPVQKDCDLVPITYADEEGRRVYERSLRFLFLLSLNRRYPGKKVRILNSVGYGLYLRLLGEEVTHEMAQVLQADMRALAAENLPFERETWRKEDAIRYFKEQGEIDKAQILCYRPKAHITLYRLGDLWDSFYGAMLPSTGYLRAFSLKSHFPGLVIQFPAPGNPSVPAPYLPRPKHLRKPPDFFNRALIYAAAYCHNNVRRVLIFIQTHAA